MCAVTKSIDLFPKRSIKGNHRVYRKCVNRGKNVRDLGKVREVRIATTKCIKEANKSAYYSNLGLSFLVLTLDINTFGPRTGKLSIRR